MTKSIKFNAGKVEYDEETHKCTPLPFKGVIQIKPSQDDPDFLSFTWTPKPDNMNGSLSTVESDELLLIPGDVSFKHVKSCDTGRVFKLTFLSSGANHLYWFQDVGDLDQLDKLTDKDMKIIKDIEEMIALNDEEEDEEEVEEEEEQEQDQEEKDEKEDQEEQQEGQEGQKQQQGKELKKSEGENFNLPITSLSNFLSLSLIEKHLDELSNEEIKQLYQSHLPESIENPTKYDIMQLVRSGFFDQSLNRLSESLTKSSGTGYLLSQTLKYDYQGEGIDGFLAGIRQLTEKEKQDKNQK